MNKFSGSRSDFERIQQTAKISQEFSRQLVQLEMQANPAASDAEHMANVIHAHAAAVMAFITATLVDQPERARAIAKIIGDDIGRGVDRFFNEVGNFENARRIVDEAEIHSFGDPVVV